MRVPGETTIRAPKARHRRRWWIVTLVIIVVAVLASLRTLATVWTDELWFSSVGLRSVWTTLLEVKVGLFASFGAIFFLLMWVNLVVSDRLSAATTSPDPEDELVRRYQRAVRPYAGWIYAVVALVTALVAASGTIGEWQNWILFTHGVSFGVNDPQFHRDVGFFVFRLPFLSFAVNWALISLAVVTVVVAVFHYLNGGIRPQRRAPRVRPAVKAHLSVLLALIALAKAAGYLISRYQLDVSNNGYVEGAGYADVHARLPALELLFWVSLAAAVVLLWNIRRQGWTLPVLAIGVWAFVALVVGVIYPAVLQAVRVNPAQSTLERPYIARNIAATRTAYNLQPNNVTVSNFVGDQPASATALQQSHQTLANARLWDPIIATPTVQKQQDQRTYYTFPALSTDRYRIDGKLTPAIVGVRQINASGLPTNSWVSVHLQYTHGQGMVLAQANQTTSAGTPQYAIGGVPTTSNKGLPSVAQPDVYFGLNDPGWVVANTKQAELDFQTASGNNVNTHYRGTGGVQLSSIFERAAFALRLGDFNLLISNQITSHSRIMFVRDIRTMAQKAAPFLSYDSSPYPVLADGHIDWVLNAYTTSDQYPYSQDIASVQTPSGSGLPGDFNYVRNSVSVVVDAYSGKMTLYAMDQHDPILRTYEQAFPSMFTPASQMPPSLRSHLRYPPDIFAAQSAIYGRYHITSPSNFYVQADAWKISPTPGVGSPSQALQVVQTRNAQGQVISGPIERMAPIYQVQQLPDSDQQTFTITEAFVPTSTGDQIQTLSAFVVGSSDIDSYGHLHVYVTTNQNVAGPALVDAKITADSSISRTLSLLNQQGSTVLLGNVLMVPVGQSMLYVRPVYVTSNRNPFPTLQYMIAVYNGAIEMKPTLDEALTSVFGTQVAGSAGSGVTPNQNQPNSTPNSAAGANATQIKQLLAQAQAEAAQAKRDLAAGNLGAYQNDVNAMESAIAQAATLAGAGSGNGANSANSNGGNGSSGGSPNAAGGGQATQGGSGSNTATSGSTPTTSVPTASSTAPGASNGAGANHGASTGATSPPSAATSGSSSPHPSTTTTSAPPGEAVDTRGAGHRS